MGIVSLAAALAAASISVPLDAAHWDAQGKVEFVEQDGQPVMRLGSDGSGPASGGSALAKGVTLGTGVLEFEMKLSSRRDFAGPLFRQAGDGFGEMVYFRPHLVGKPDSIQYTPIVHDNMAWQIFTGPGFEAESVYPIDRWMRVRVDLYRTSALVSVDSRPILHIPHLKGPAGAGEVGVAALIGPFQVRDFTVTPIADYRDPRTIAPEPKLAQGTVGAWQVSAPMDETQARRRAAAGDWRGVEWTVVEVESNGIANLNKAGPDDDRRHHFLARYRIRSASARRAAMDFGFSDSVRIYVNGEPLYEGADLQNSRDYRFLGHVGFWDSLFVPLRKGANEVVFVVSDNTGGGAAAAARFKDVAGLTFE